MPAFVRYDTAGTLLDSIPDDRRWLAAGPSRMYAPSQSATLYPDGRLLLLRTDRVGFLLISPTGGKPFVAEIAANPPRYIDDERKEIQALEDWIASNAVGRTRQEVPELKLLCRGLLVDLDGRIWIQRTAEGVKIPPVTSRLNVEGKGAPVSQNFTRSYAEPVVYVAFQPDGTFLGELHFPVNAKVSFIGKTAWAVVPGKDDEPVLVKYKIGD
jgi:hypothetical protein